MIQITPEQARTRLKTLPEDIKSAVFSPQTSDIIGQIGEEGHLPQDKVSKMAGVAGLVLMGFLHAEDAAKELEQAMAINSLMARSLQDSLQKKLFSRYSGTLEKIYSPKPEEEAHPQKIFDSVIAAKPASPAAPRPLADISAQKAPTPVSPPAEPAVAKIPPPPKGPSAPPSPQPTAPAAKQQPAPFVIHAEGKEPQIVRAPKTKFEPAAGSLSAFGVAGRAPIAPPPPKPAQIEIGKEEKLKPVPKIGIIESAPKAIHYTSLSSPISAASGGPSAPPSVLGKAPTQAQPVPIPVKNPVAAPSFGGLVKEMVSPKKEDASPKPPVPATPPPAK